MAVCEERPETARGRRLCQALLAVHAHIRRGFGSVEQLAAAVRDGLSAEGLHEELEALKGNSCSGSSRSAVCATAGSSTCTTTPRTRRFFDELEQTNPAIGPVVERLRADHRAVSDYLDAVEAAARALTDDDGDDARRAVADALEALKGHLLDHLEYEERNVAVTARRLRDFP